MRRHREFIYGSFLPELETVRRFVAFGTDTVIIYPANTVNSLGTPYCAYGPTWLGQGQYDFSELDRQIADLVAVSERIRLVVMIDLNSPAWWVRQNSFNAMGGDSFTQLGRVVSFPKWRADTRAYLEAFLRHAEGRHAERTIAYVLSCGATCEWQDWSQGEESACRRHAFRTWSQERGHADPVDIPPASVRDRATHDLLRDPEADAQAVLYWRFCNWQVAEALLEFARAAQQVIAHRAELGVFFGYVLEYSHRRLVSEGHLDYGRVVRSEDIDFLVAPGTYGQRQMGAPSGFMTTVGSLYHRGKGYIQQLDHRTPTSKRPIPGYGAAFDIWKTEEETIAGLRREFAYGLIEGTSLWWFDMWGGFYDLPAVADAVAGMKRIWDDWSDDRQGNAAQIALIVDPESCLYMDQHNERIGTYLSDLRFRMGRVGAPYRAFSMDDLADLDLSGYRLLVFPNLFVVDDARLKLLRRRVLGGGRHVLWFDRPGIICGGRYDPAGVERLCGLPAGRSEAESCRMDGWTSILSPSPEMRDEALRRIVREAGVHIYCDSGEPLYAGRRLVALHTARGGQRHVRLPVETRQVTELFSGRIVARHCSEFDDLLPAPATALYAVDP